MSRLNDLYKAMETLRKEGLPVNENFERKANEIKKEILPISIKSIEPALQPVQRELVCSWLYSRMAALSSKRNFTADMPDVKEIMINQEITYCQYDSHNSTEDKIQCVPTRDIAVFFLDGTIIAENITVETLVAVVKNMGVAEVC